MIKKVKLAEITPDANNANKGTERGHAQLTVSMREFGYADAGTLDKHNRIINGNKRTEVAADVLGVDEALVVEVDGKTPIFIKRTDIDLDTKQGRKLAYALNRVHETSYELDPLQLANDLEQYGNDLVSDYWREDELIALINDYKVDDLTDGEGVKNVNLDDNETSTIELNYTSEDFIKVKQALAKIANTPEQAVWALLFGDGNE